MNAKNITFGLIVVLLFSGTVGMATAFITVETPKMEFEAEKACISPSVLNTYGYVRAFEEPLIEEKSIGKAGIVIGVNTTSYINFYLKTTMLEQYPPSSFFVISTPQCKVFTHAFNPIAEMSDEEILKTFQRRIGYLENIEKVDEEIINVDSHRTTLSKFKADANMPNYGKIPLYLLIAKYLDNNDIIVAIGAYPIDIAETEHVNIKEMIFGIRHPVPGKPKLRVTYEISSRAKEILVTTYVENIGEGEAKDVKLTMGVPPTIKTEKLVGVSPVGSSLVWSGELMAGEKHTVKQSIIPLKEEEIKIPVTVSYTDFAGELSEIEIIIKIAKGFCCFLCGDKCCEALAPGFEAVFAIVGLLAGAYLIKRRK